MQYLFGLHGEADRVKGPGSRGTKYPQRDKTADRRTSRFSALSNPSGIYMFCTCTIRIPLTSVNSFVGNVNVGNVFVQPIHSMAEQVEKERQNRTDGPTGGIDNIGIRHARWPAHPPEPPSVIVSLSFSGISRTGEAARSDVSCIHGEQFVRTKRIGDDVGQKRIGVVNGKWVTKPRPSPVRSPVNNYADTYVVFGHTRVSQRKSPVARESRVRTCASCRGLHSWE